jgi:DNA-binding transcriptional LysR family regulator
MVEQLDLRRVHTLRVIEQQGTVTAAAELLHLTPSAVSHQITQLAKELGLQLLERRGRRVYLTPAAQALVTHADDLSARWERARADLQHHADHAGGSVRMHGFPSAVAGLLVPTVKHLQDRHPSLRTCIVETEGRQGYDLLLTGEADITVTVPTAETPSMDNPRFHQEPLMEEPMDLLVPASHRLAGHSEALIIDVAEDDWIVPVPGSCDFYELTLAACTMAGYTPKIAHQARDNWAVTAMVAEGLGVALVPRLAATQPRGNATRLPIGDHPRPSRRILACTRAGSDDQPAIRTALEALRTTAQSALHV